MWFLDWLLGKGEEETPAGRVPCALTRDQIDIIQKDELCPYCHTVLIEAMVADDPGTRTFYCCLSSCNSAFRVSTGAGTWGMFTGRVPNLFRQQRKRSLAWDDSDVEK